MKKLIFLTLLIVFSVSCKNPNREDSLNEINVKELTSSFASWWEYHYNTITLSLDFVAFDETSEKITKEAFFKKLVTGNFIVKEIKNSRTSYKLFRIPKNADNKISETIKYISSKAYKYYKMEGVKMPEFTFTDLNNNTYDNKSLFNKTTIIKTWFINCSACIAEMPDLNMFFNTYKNNDKLQFISLATDNEELLEAFLEKKSFSYPVVANQKDFIENTLNLTTYPSHIVINKFGKIEKIFNNAQSLIGYINYSIKPVKDTNYNDLPPPPEPKLN